MHFMLHVEKELHIQIPLIGYVCLIRRGTAAVATVGRSTCEGTLKVLCSY